MIDFVACQGHANLVRLALERGADINGTLLNKVRSIAASELIIQSGKTPLHVVAGSYQSNSDTVRVLLEHGADASAVDEVSL